MPVFKRNHKWEIRLQIKGKRYYRQVPEAANKAQANLAEARLKLEIFEGNYGKQAGSRDFVKFCRDVYLPQMKTQAKTYKNIEYKVDVLCRYFRGKELRDITQIAIAGYKRKRLSGDSRLGRARKPITVKQEINTLSGILNLAIDNDLLGTNPCRRVKFTKGSLVSKRNRILEDEEEEILIPVLTHSELRSAVVIALETGLRRNEIIKRHRDDLDEQKRLLTLSRKGGKIQTVPLNSIAFAEFQRLAKVSRDGKLFHIPESALTATHGLFKNALRKAKIHGLTFHDLRRTFASRMKRLTDPFTSRDLMGHSSATMTGEYTVQSIEDMRAAVERLAGRNRTVIHREFTKAGEKQ